METTEQTTGTRIDAALLAAQAEFPEIPKDKENAHYHQRYSSLDAIISGTRPSLTKNLLLLTHRVEDTETGVRVTALLKHLPSGEERANALSCECSRMDPQRLGSAITYLRRYTVSSLLGITPDEDDDGNAAKPREGERPRQPAQKSQPSQPPAGKPPAPPAKGKGPAGNVQAAHEREQAEARQAAARHQANQPKGRPDPEMEAIKAKMPDLPLAKLIEVIAIAKTVEHLTACVVGPEGGSVHQTPSEWKALLDAIKDRYVFLQNHERLVRDAEFETMMNGQREKNNLDLDFQATEEKWDKADPPQPEEPKA